MSEKYDFTRFSDVPLPVEAVVQGSKLKVSELLALKPGSVVTTRFPAGESVDIRAGKTNIGSGELGTSKGRLIVRMLEFRGKE